ncbi:ROK family protein [Streptomyces wedmorensis]
MALHTKLAEQVEPDLLAAVICAGDSPMSRLRYVTESGLSAPTVSRAARALIKDGLLAEGEQFPIDRRGRPEITLKVNPKRVHLGLVVEDEAEPAGRSAGVRVVGMPVTLDGKPFEGLSPIAVPIAHRKIPDLITSVADTVRQLRHKVEERGGGVEGVGVTLGGHISADNWVEYSSNIGSEQDQPSPLGSHLQEAIQLPVMLENDANALARRHLWFTQEPTSTYAIVLLKADGIGCGIVADGSVFSGARGMAGEFGHLPMDPNGPVCRCKNDGCLEAIATPRAISRSLGVDGFDQVIRAAADHDEEAARVLGEAGSCLGRALAMLINLVDPGKIFLLGVDELTDREANPTAAVYLDAMAEAVQKHVFRSARDRYDLEHIWAYLTVSGLLTETETTVAAAAQCIQGVVSSRSGSNG